MLEHITLINPCENIHKSQMDVWPNEILMTTIHTEAIWPGYLAADNLTEWVVMVIYPPGA